MTNEVKTKKHREGRKAGKNAFRLLNYCYNEVILSPSYLCKYEVHSEEKTAVILVYLFLFC